MSDDHIKDHYHREAEQAEQLRMLKRRERYDRLRDILQVPGFGPEEAMYASGPHGRIDHMIAVRLREAYELSLLLPMAPGK